MSPSVSQDAIGSVVDDRYRLTAKIGTGPSAKVYLADDIRLRRRVAVKILGESLAEEAAFVGAFGGEMQAAAALRHPHIAMVHDWGIDEAPYVVGEYFQAGSLRGLLDRGDLLDPSQALQIALAAARALSYAHDRGVVHRDLRPANLFFGDDGRLKIGDFGLARAQARAASTRPMGAGMLAVQYASPEQARGSDVDGRSDVYALALIVIEAVTGEVPFTADTALATVLARVDRTPNVPPELGAMADVLTRASTIDASERLDAGGLVTALMAVADTYPDPEPLPLTRDTATVLPDVTDEPDLEDITLVVTPEVAVATTPPVRSQSVEPVVPPVADEPPPEPVEGAPVGAAGTRAATRSEEVDTEAATPRGFERNRRRWRVAWVVLLLVSVVGGGTVGYLVWHAHRTPTHLVPSVEGATPAVAESRLTRLGFRVESKHVRRDGTRAGQLLGVDPAPGTRIAEGGTVTLTVSDGQTLVKIPAKLAGMTEQAGQNALTGLGLKVGPGRTDYSEDVPDGRIIGTDPAIGEQLEKGSTVTLVVSDGPKPRVVPSIAGMSPDQAETALSDIGLVPVVVQRYDEKIDTGGLIGLEPGAGTTLPRGAKVDVVVSKGLLVAVPSLNGVTTVSGAIERLQAVGLHANALGGTGSLSGTPVAFDPPAGELVVKGSSVDIIVR